MRVKVVRFIGLAGFLRAMAVGGESQNRGGVVPSVSAPAFRHPDQLAKRQVSGVESKDSGEFPDEVISILATASGSTSSIFNSA